jgi:site-specific recombinase
MIMDKRSEFADNVAIGGATGRRLIGDVIDLGQDRDIGAAANMYLVVQVSVTATSGTSSTAQVELVSDAQAAIAVDGSASVHVASGVIAHTAMIAGTTLFQTIIPLEGATAYERYLGLIINVGTAAFTAGSVNAFLTMQPPVHKSYPNGAT